MNFARGLTVLTMQQFRSVMKHITPEQLSQLGEIAHNILHGTIGQDLLKQLKPFVKIIEVLGDYDISYKRRRRSAARHWRQIFQIVKFAKDWLPSS